MRRLQDIPRKMPPRRGELGIGVMEIVLVQLTSLSRVELLIETRQLPLFGYMVQ